MKRTLSLARSIVTAAMLVLAISASAQGPHAQLLRPTCDDPGLGNCDSLPEYDGCSTRFAESCATTNCEPLWRFTADALFLDRNDPSPGVIAFNTANPTQQLRGEDFNFGNQGGFDLSLTRRLGCANAIELRYFAVDDWDSSVTGATTPNQLLQFNAAVPIFAQSGDGFTANLASKLHNSEINGKHQVCDWLNLLAGFRYLELDERAGASLINAAVPVAYSARTSNRLYGAQLGGEAALLHNKHINLDFVGKAGIYGNHSSHSASVATGAGTVTARGNGSPTAFIGEIGVIGALRLTNHLSIRSGYKLLWLDGVAEASDQLAATNFFSGTGYNGSGDVFYHGTFAGFEFTY